MKKNSPQKNSENLVGQQAPEFTLPDQNGDMHSLSDYRGKWVILYFYPKDDTPGCTIQACDIRDNWSEYQKLHAVVIGISADSLESHQKFEAKYDLPFTLLSDPQKTVLKSFHAYREKNLYGKIMLGIVRSTVIIDPEGKIAKHYKRVQAKKHAEQTLAFLKQVST